VHDRGYWYCSSYSFVGIQFLVVVMLVRMVGRMAAVDLVVVAVVTDFSIVPPHLDYSNYNNSVPVVLVVSIRMTQSQ